MLFSVLLDFHQVFICTSVQSTVIEKDVYKVDIQSLNVVLFTLPESGNLAPLLMPGEELVRRGYSGTLITTTQIDSRTIEQAGRVGVTYKSAGDFSLQSK